MPDSKSLMPDLRELFRFLVTGVVATIGNMFVVWLLRGSCSLNLSLAAGLATGMIISFVMMKTFAFKASDWTGARGEMLRFLIVYLAGTGCYFVVALIAEHVLRTAGLSKQLAAMGGVVAGGGTMAVTSYFGHRHFTYRQRPRVQAGGRDAPPPLSSLVRTVIVFFIAFVVQMFVMNPGILLYDEGLILDAALLAQAGEVMHRDFYFVYGPGAPWALALLWKLSAYQFLVARLYGAAIIAAITACADRLMRYLPDSLRWLFTAIVLLSMTGSISYLYPVFPCILLCLIGAGLLLAAPAEPWNWRCFAAGAMAGMALLFRYDVGIAIAVAQGLWIVLLDRRMRREPAWTLRPVLIRAGLYAAGGTAIGVPLLLAGLASDALTGFWHDVLISGSTYYQTHRALPFPDMAEIASRPSALAVYFPLLALVLSAATFLLLGPVPPAAGSAAQRRIAATASLMATLTFVLYYKGVVRVQPLHFILSIVPATILLGLCAGRLWAHGRPFRIGAIVGGLALALPPLHTTTAMMAGIAGVGTVGERLIAATRGTDTDRDRLARCVDRPATRFAWLPDSYAVIAGYVRRHTRADEAVYVGLNRHNRIVKNDVALYFVAGRRPGTHWAILDPGLQTRADIQTAMIADLSRAQVRWIVRNSAYEAIHEPNLSDSADGAVVLDRWIASHYRAVGNAGPLAIWLRRDVPVPADDRAPAGCHLDPAPAAPATGTTA